MSVPHFLRPAAPSAPPTLTWVPPFATGLFSWFPVFRHCIYLFTFSLYWKYHTGPPFPHWPLPARTPFPRPHPLTTHGPGLCRQVHRLVRFPFYLKNLPDHPVSAGSPLLQPAHPTSARITPPPTPAPPAAVAAPPPGLPRPCGLLGFSSLRAAPSPARSPRRPPLLSSGRASVSPIPGPGWLGSFSDQFPSYSPPSPGFPSPSSASFFLSVPSLILLPAAPHFFHPDLLTHPLPPALLPSPRARSPHPVSSPGSPRLRPFSPRLQSPPMFRSPLIVTGWWSPEPPPVSLRPTPAPRFLRSPPPRFLRSPPPPTPAAPLPSVLPAPDSTPPPEFPSAPQFVPPAPRPHLLQTPPQRRPRPAGPAPASQAPPPAPAPPSRPAPRDGKQLMGSPGGGGFGGAGAGAGAGGAGAGAGPGAGARAAA